MTEATMKALDGLRDLTTLEWYVVSLLGIVAYIYTKASSSTTPFPRAGTNGFSG